MKRLAVLFAACAAVLVARRAQAYEHSVTTSPLGALGGSYTVRYEVPFKKENSLQLELNFVKSSVDVSFAEERVATSTLSFTASAGYAFYSSDAQVPAGFFIAPGGQVRWADTSTKTSKGATRVKGTSVVPHVLFGYNGVWESGFTLGIALGPGYDLFFGEATGSIDGVAAKGGGLDFTGGIYAGYTF